MTINEAADLKKSHAGRILKIPCFAPSLFAKDSPLCAAQPRGKDYAIMLFSFCKSLTIDAYTHDINEAEGLKKSHAGRIL